MVRKERKDDGNIIYRGMEGSYSREKDLLTVTDDGKKGNQTNKRESEKTEDEGKRLAAKFSSHRRGYINPTDHINKFYFDLCAFSGIG